MGSEVTRTFCVLVALGAVVALLAAPARATDIHGDDDTDRYVGTGGLLLPGGISASTRQEVASCQGCEWRLSSPCVTSDAGNPFSGTPTCMSVVRGCPQLAEHLRAWFRPEDGRWRDLGMVCISAGGPSTIVELTAEIRDWMEKRLPPLRASMQPPRGIVTQIPVVFDSGQSSAGISTGVEIGSDYVHLDAAPAWRWEYGDGVRVSTNEAGGKYPDTSVTHAYRVAGNYRVRVLTAWSASFTVDGLGPFAVNEPVTQAAALTVEVGEGRAVLTTR